MPVLSTLRAARPVVAAFAAMGIVWGTFAAVLPDLKAMLGVNEAQLGGLILFTPLAAVTMMLLAPGIGAGLGRVALPVAAGLMALAFFLPGNVPVWWLFPPAMMCCGAATGLTDVLMNARAAQIEHDRGIYLMNLTHAAYSFAYAGAAVGTGFLRGVGWPPGLVMSIMALVALGIALLTIERNGAIDGLRRPEGENGRGLGPVPLIGGLMVLVAFLTENAAESWSALHIEKTLGGSPEQGAMGPAIIALTMGFARLGGQGLTARIGPFRLLRLAALVAAGGALIAATAWTPAMAYAGFVVMGVGASVIVPTAFSLVGQLGPDKARARAIARATLLGYFGFFFGPPMLGVIAGGLGLRYAFVFAAILLMALLALAPMMAAAGARRPSDDQSGDQRA